MVSQPRSNNSQGLTAQSFDLTNSAAGVNPLITPREELFGEQFSSIHKPYGVLVEIKLL